MSIFELELRVPDRQVRKRAIWYQLMYNLAAHQAHFAMEPHRRVDHPILFRAAPSFFGDARSTAAVLLAAASRTLVELEDAVRERRWWERRLSEPLVQLRTFLAETMEPASAVLLAGLLSDRRGEPIESTFRVSNRSEIPELVFPISESTSAGLSDALVRYVLELPAISYRVHYNLACYFSGLLGREDGETATEALRELDRALRGAPASERRALAAWAPNDPSLRALSTQRRAEFDELLALYVNPELKQRLGVHRSG